MMIRFSFYPLHGISHHAAVWLLLLCATLAQANDTGILWQPATLATTAAWILPASPQQTNVQGHTLLITLNEGRRMRLDTVALDGPVPLPPGHRMTSGPIQQTRILRLQGRQVWWQQAPDAALHNWVAPWPVDDCHFSAAVLWCRSADQRKLVRWQTGKTPHIWHQHSPIVRWQAQGERAFAVRDDGTVLRLADTANGQAEQVPLYRSGDAVQALLVTPQRVLLGTSRRLVLINPDAAAYQGWWHDRAIPGGVQQLAADVDKTQRGWLSSGAQVVYRMDWQRTDHLRIVSWRALAKPAQRLLALSQQRLLTVEEDAIRIYDGTVHTPEISTLYLDAGEGVNYGGQRRMTTDEQGVIYVADWFAGLHLYRMDEQGHLSVLASMATPGSAKGVVVRQGYAYVADDDHGLQVVDVSDPEQPHIIASLALPGLSYTPLLQGNRLYMAAHRGGLHTIDVSDPQHPRLLHTLATPGMVWSVVAFDQGLVIADDAGGVGLLSLADPDAPAWTGHYQAGGRVEEVRVQGHTLVLADFEQGLSWLDISDPAHPRLLQQRPQMGNSRGLDWQGHDLFVADWRGGVAWYFSAPGMTPVLQDHWDTEGAAWGVLQQGDYLLVADWWGGLQSLRIDRAGRRLQRGDRFADSGKVHALAFVGQQALVATDRGVQVFDLQNPMNPTWRHAFLDDHGIDDIQCRPDARCTVLLDSGSTLYFDMQHPMQPVQQQAALPMADAAAHAVSWQRLEQGRRWRFANGFQIAFDRPFTRLQRYRDTVYLLGQDHLYAMPYPAQTQPQQGQDGSWQLPSATAWPTGDYQLRDTAGHWHPLQVAHAHYGGKPAISAARFQQLLQRFRGH